MTDSRPVPVPKTLRPIWILLFVQAALSIAIGVFILALVSTMGADESDGAALLTALAVIGIVFGAVLLACAVLIPRRLPWVRVTIIVIEAVNGIGGVIGLLSGIAEGAVQPQTIVPILISGLVIQGLSRAEVRAWIAREADTHAATPDH